MERLATELFGKTEIPYPVMLLHMTGAIILGAVIGAEREYRNQASSLCTSTGSPLSLRHSPILSCCSFSEIRFAEPNDGERAADKPD